VSARRVPIIFRLSFHCSNNRQNRSTTQHAPVALEKNIHKIKSYPKPDGHDRRCMDCYEVA
ncbi:hypothetical protein, partial [Salmonella enterica]|uniref:hypothetical protein n=1 Tax=Salmonella enterica TaxID=28901 RepID=UPI001C63104E